MREEVGVAVPMARPLWLNQAFFTGADGIRRHEWCLYTLLTTPEELLARGESFTREEHGQRLTFRWTSTDALPDGMEPAFLRDVLPHLPDTLQLTTHRT